MAKAPKRAARPTAPKHSAAPKKAPPAARKPAARRAAPATTEAPAAAPLLDRLAAQSGLDAATLLDRALRAFAAAHGLTAAEASPVAAPAPAAAAAPTPAVRAPAAKAAKAAAPVPAAADDGKALGPEVRLYIHGLGRPPQEMIKDTYVIGSSKKCDLWVNGPKIETNHLRIDRYGAKYFMTDLQTAGGTKIGSETLTAPREIKHEDSVYLAGYHRVRFYLLSGTD